MASLTEDTHTKSHAKGIPEICQCWADCECRKDTCNPKREPPTILDMDGKEIKEDDILDCVPVDGHICDAAGCHRRKLIFKYSSGEQPRASGGGGNYSERGDFFAAGADETGAPVGYPFIIHRRERKENHYHKHDFRIAGRARDPKEERRQERGRNAEAIYTKEPVEVQEKYKARAAPCEFRDDGSFDGTYIFNLDNFTETLKGMRHDYYLENISSGEGEIMDIAGFDEEGKAIDHLLEAYSKYGQWYLWKWDREKKVWLEAKLKRNGKGLQVAWTAGSPG